MMTVISRPWRLVRLAILSFLAAGALAACGDNLFDTDNPPELDAFAPDAESVAEGDTLRFSVDASGPRTIDRIRMVLSGALVGDTIFDVDDPGTNVTGTVWVAIPEGSGPSSELTVTAWAIDVAPDTSESRTATVQIIDQTPPTVSATVGQEEVGAGETILIDISASDNRGVQTLGAVVTDGAGYDTTLTRTLDPAQLTHEVTLALVAPSIDFAELAVRPFATDVNGLEADGDPSAVLLSDRKGPTFVDLNTRPDSTIPLEDSLQVIVQLEDPSGIQRVTFIGLAYRGDASMGTDSVVERFEQKTIEFPRPTEAPELPTQYTLDPYLFGTDEAVTEEVELLVIAEDGLGNVSDTTKLMYVGGPDVSITYPPEGYGVGVSDNFNVMVAINDPAGIDSAKLVVQPGSVIDLALPARTDTPMVLVQNVTMPASEGTVDIQAWAWNRAEVGGQSRTVSVDVFAAAPADAEAPVVSVTAERLVPGGGDTRMELLDQVRVVVSAFDGNSGLARIGLKAVVTRSGVESEITEEALFSASKSLETVVFQVTVDSLYDLLGVDSAQAARDAILPEDLDFRIHGFAADEAGNVACAVGPDEQRGCDPSGYSPTEFYEASDTTGLLLEIDAVRGRTVLLANTQAVIADLVFDTAYERLYMSDINANRVWGLPVHTDLASLVADSQFSVSVGSAPWGMFIGERAAGQRMLIVGNSGGTNMSFVDINQPNPGVIGEADLLRLLTPNNVLFTVTITTDDFGNTRYVREPDIDFSDRPQFLAQDSLRRIVYSTVTTEAAPTSTIRYVITDPAPAEPDDEPEVRFILNDDMINPDDDASLAIANIDDLDIREYEGFPDSISFIGHVPGYPDQPIVTPHYAQPDSALLYLNNAIATALAGRGDGSAAGMYQAQMWRGTWDLPDIGWSDTTFVSASGDGGRIVIGEGAAAPTGRIVMWFAEPSAVTSGSVPIRDLMNNASEEVLGVGLNENGSLGVARGRDSTYFFTPDLRLQGLYAQGSQGGAGAAFHPEHDDPWDGSDETAASGGFAFTGTADRSVEVVNTFHFYQVDEIAIRDNIVGPLKVAPPLRDEQACTGPDCVVAKLYAITDAGGVVILNVRRRDLETP